MEVSPNALRKETVAVLRAVNEHIENYENEARMVSRSPFHIFDQHGNNDYASLLATKAQCLNTLVLLRIDEDNRKRK